MVRRIHRPRCLALAVVALTTVDAWCDTSAARGVRLYASNAAAGMLDVVDWRGELEPTLRKRVEFGADREIRDVAVSRHGWVVVALREKRDVHGRIVVFDAAGQPRGSIAVPRAPERLLTSEDGRVVVVEHSPSDSEAATGVGRFSVVDWGEVGVVTVELSRFPALRGRISSSEDAEPKELTSHDFLALEDGSSVAVLLRAQGVRVVVESTSLSVRAVQPLGGDSGSGFSTTHYEVKQLPAIGNTVAGQMIRLGGFSGLHYAGKTPNGKLRFITHTDRGPNGEMREHGRPFLLPRFNPRLVWLELDPRTRHVRVVKQLLLTQADGSPLLGLPNVYSPSSPATSADEVPVSLLGKVLPQDPLGADFEGMAVADDGSFWLADEYRPSLYHFDVGGRLLERVVPIGSHAAAGLTPPAPGETGPLGVEALPSVLAHRRQNRGFEAVSFQSGKVYAMVQSPLRYPATMSDEEVSRMRNVRLIELDPVRRTSRQFIYVMDHPERKSPEDSPADKIGDMTALPGGGFLVVERDDDSQAADLPSTIHKKVYFFGVDSATDVSTKDRLYSGKSLDQLSVGELLKLGIKPIEKRLHVDLAAAGYRRVQKVEGLAWIDEGTIAVLNDNDFGVGRISIDGSTGKFSLLPDYEPEPVLLGVVSRTVDAEVAAQAE